MRLILVFCALIVCFVSACKPVKCRTNTYQVLHWLFGVRPLPNFSTINVIGARLITM